jgi:hypothetical protein
LALLLVSGHYPWFASAKNSGGGQNFTKFLHEKHDFYLYKAYFMEKMTQIHQIFKGKEFQIARFLS